MNDYRVVETTHFPYARNFSFVSENDIQNGAIVGKGELVDGERSIYNATTATATNRFLISNPAWSYDDYKITDQNEENYINEAGKPYRVYALRVGDRFTIYNITETFEVGDYVAYDESTDTFAADGDGANLYQVVWTESLGFPYCVGSEGVLLDTTTTDEETGETTGESYGYTLSTKMTKYVIEVVA